MEAILFVTADPAHRFLYEHGLKKRFRLVFAAPGASVAERVAAVVYDLASEETRERFDWVEGFRVPVVVLTPDPYAPVPHAERQVVLEYPVSAQRLLEALASLGVKA